MSTRSPVTPREHLASQVPPYPTRRVARVLPRRSPGPESGFRPVLTIRGRVDPHESAEFIQQSLRDIRAYIEEHHLAIDDAPFALCHAVSATEIDLEAGWPLAHYAPGTSRIHAGEVPANLLRHTGGSEVARSDGG